MELKRNIIYKATNILNKKVYIGESKFSLEERRNEHLKESRFRCNNIFFKALRKNGFENFHWEILDHGITNKKDRLDLESKYIKIYKTLLPLGYNMRASGEFCEMTKEIKDKISRKQKENLINPSPKRLEGYKKRAISLSNWHNTKSREVKEVYKKIGIGVAKANENPSKKMIEGRKKISQSLMIRAKNPTEKMKEGRIKAGKKYSQTQKDPTEKMLAGWKIVGDKLKILNETPTEKMLLARERYKDLCKNPTENMLKGRRKNSVKNIERLRLPVHQILDGKIIKTWKGKEEITLDGSFSWRMVYRASRIKVEHRGYNWSFANKEEGF